MRADMRRLAQTRRRALVFLLLSGAGMAFASSGVGGQHGLVRTISAKTLGKTKMNVGAGINYAQSHDFMLWKDHPNYPPGPLPETAKLLSTNAFLALGLTSYWDLAASMPFYWDGSENGPRSEFGMGDLEISTKLLYPPPEKKRVFYQAYHLGVAAGLTDLSNRGIYPRHGYYYVKDGDGYRAGDIFTADGFVAKALMLWSFDIQSAAPRIPVEITINGGIAIPNSRKAITGLANLSLQYSPVDVVSLFVDCASELRGNTVLRDPLGMLKEMILVTPGIRIRSPAGVYVTLAADIGLSEDSEESRTVWNRDGGTYTTAPVPPVGVQFSFGWDGFLAPQDDDKDGIRNNEDRCPKDPEDIDGFEDNDGCPDPDNDNDGIADVKDKCPNDPEDRDGFQDEDGCPDPDNDGDGITDLMDQCPKAPEDFDGFEDKDGCPDPDNDKDGIADSLDRCPNDPEDFDKFQDDDGCPDVDNDKDGIPDIKDRCPNEPEVFNNLDDEDGCPDQKREESKMPKFQVLEGINFKGAGAEMTFDSYQRISGLVEELKRFPEIEVEIRGHTDATGSSTANMQVSQLRAQAVRQYLIAQGIDGSRVRALGFGASSPIADNRTALGRTKNRRIEVVRIK